MGQHSSRAWLIEEVSLKTSRSSFLVVMEGGMKNSVADRTREKVDQFALSHGRLEGTYSNPSPTLKEIVLWSEPLYLESTIQLETATGRS